MGVLDVISSIHSHHGHDRGSFVNERDEIRVNVVIRDVLTGTAYPYKVRHNKAMRGIFAVFVAKMSAEQHNGDTSAIPFGSYRFEHMKRPVHPDQSPKQAKVCDGDDIWAYQRTWCDQV